MILLVCVSIKEVLEKGRAFPWSRPRVCPGCAGRRIWRDGFESRFYDGCNERVWLRRYRCCECDCVIRVRPQGYFPRFQASINSIRSRIVHRLDMGTWAVGMSGSRQRHWLSSLKRNVQAHLGAQWMDRLVEGFDRLIEKSIIPVSRFKIE
jgi:hypothetical protein